MRRVECLICLIDCKCHYHITHAPSTPLDTGYWPLSRYYPPDIVTMHFAHVPSHPCAQNYQVEKNSYSFQFNLQEYKG